MTGAESLRQQVNALVLLTFDADATLDVEELVRAISDDVGRITSETSPDDEREPVELVEHNVIEIMEEAEIYAVNKEPLPRKGTLQRTKLEDEAYKTWREAEAAWVRFCNIGDGNGPELAFAAAEAQARFIQVYGSAS